MKKIYYIIIILILFVLISITASSINITKTIDRDIDYTDKFDYHENNPVQYRIFKEWFNIDLEYFSNVLLYLENMYGGNIGRE